MFWREEMKGWNPHRSRRHAAPLVAALALVTAPIVVRSAIAQERGDDHPPRSTWPEVQPGPEDQPAAPTRPALEVAVLGGSIVPLGNLIENRDGINAKLSSNGAVGGELALWLPSGVGVAGSVLYSQVSVVATPGANGFALTSGGLGNARYVAALAEVRYRYATSGAHSVIEPYWSVGGGIRRISFDPIAAPDLTTASNFVFTTALGTYANVSPRWGLRLDLRFLAGRYSEGISDTNLSETDLSLGLAAVLRLF